MTARNTLITTFIFFLLAIGVLGMLVLPTLAQTQPAKVKVNLPADRTLTVRSTPAGTKIGSQRGGNEGTLVGSVQTASGRLWQQVNFDSDPDGFVASEFLLPVGTPPTPPPPPAQTAGCPDGELTFFDPINYPGLRGRHNVVLNTSQSRVFCARLDYQAANLQFAATDVNQCASLKLTVFLPTSRDAPVADSANPLNTTSVAVFPSTLGLPLSAPLPQGMWRVKIENSNDGCNTGQIRIYWHGDELRRPPPLPPSPTGQLQKGTRVEVATDLGVSLTVRDAAGGNRAGSQPRGTQGIIQEGPEEKSTYTWWKVDFDPAAAGRDIDGLPRPQAGWVAGKYLVPAGQQTADCAQGEIPELDFTGDDVWGRDWVPIGDGEVHTHCFTLKSFSRSVQIIVADRTGYDQCTWNTTEFIPPPGSGWETQVGTGRGASYTFYNEGAGLPQGTWRIRITEAITPNCNDKYLVVVHP